LFSNQSTVYRGGYRTWFPGGADIWVEDFDKNNATGKNSACLNIGPASCSCDHLILRVAMYFAYICVHKCFFKCLDDMELRKYM
jgi:hypothetical protein